jgi:hypothetical protein
MSLTAPCAWRGSDLNRATEGVRPITEEKSSGRQEANLSQTVKDALRKNAGNACSIGETATGGSDNIGKAAHLHDAWERDAVRPSPTMDAAVRKAEVSALSPWTCSPVRQ